MLTKAVSFQLVLYHSGMGTFKSHKKRPLHPDQYFTSITEQLNLKNLLIQKVSSEKIGPQTTSSLTHLLLNQFHLIKSNKKY